MGQKKKHKKSHKKKHQLASAVGDTSAGPRKPPAPAPPPLQRKAARSWLLLPVLACVGVAGVALIVWRNASDSLEFPEPRAHVSAAGAPTFDDFAGSEACEECHEKQYEVWLSSTHGRAGGLPSPDVVIAPFDGRPMRFFDATVTPSITASGNYIFTVEQEYAEPVVFEVSGVIGGGHMVGGGTQGFVPDYPDGTVRFLPFDFIRDEAEWFCNTSVMDSWVPITPSLRLSDCMDWPPYRIVGTERRNDTCQECHGSQIVLTYDPEAGRYETKILSYSINCESCHGPSKRHVELADAGLTDEADDIAVEALSTRGKDGSLGVCFRCHALKSVVASGYLPGRPLDEHYSLQSWLVGDSPFFPDGRVRFFAYQQNHVYSDCYLNGSMTCVDCHDPHSQEYRDIWGRQLSDRFADEQCTDCHPSKAERPEEHTFHEPGTPGSKCVDCHMPYLQHPGIGDELRFARSDHTIPIPRPGTDDRMGIVNACALSECHADSTVQALEEVTREWYGEIKPRKAIIDGQTGTLDALDRVTAASILLDPEVQHPIAQVTALGYYVKQYLRPDMGRLEPAVVESLRQLAVVDNLDVRSVALATLHFALGDSRETRRFLVDELRASGNMDHAVRARWVTAMHLFGDWLHEQGAYPATITVYNKALELLPNHPGVLYSMGWTYDVMHDFSRAIEYYEQSLAIAPNQPDLQLDLDIARENLAAPGRN